MEETPKQPAKDSENSAKQESNKSDDNDGRYSMKLKDPDLFDFAVYHCIGSRVGQQVTVIGMLKNKAMDDKYAKQFQFDNAIDENGKQYERSDRKINDKNRWCADIDCPRGVPIKINFKLLNVSPDIKRISYLRINVGSTLYPTTGQIELYDVPIMWK